MTVVLNALSGVEVTMVALTVVAAVAAAAAAAAAAASVVLVLVAMVTRYVKSWVFIHSPIIIVDG